MEKLVRSCNKEHMRIAMLKHEQTLKEQVYELHRLYSIQKILMKNMEARGGNELASEGGEWYLKNVISLTSNGHHQYHNKGSQEKPQMLKFDLEHPAEEEEHVAESDDGVVEIIDETKIELTLGPSSYNRSRKISESSSSSTSTRSSDMNETNHARREESRESFGIEGQLRQESLKQPPWLFQVLNLNMA